MTEEQKREEEQIEEEKKALAQKKRKWIIISACVAASGLLFSFLLALFSTQKTILRNGIIAGIVVTIMAWTAIFLYFSIAFPDRYTGRKIRDLLAGKKERLTGPVGKRVRITLQDWPKYVLALMGAVLFSAAIFYNVDNVSAKKKITFFANTFQPDAKALEDTLYEARPEGITRVRIHMFSYALLSEKEVRETDAFIIHESDFEDFKEDFADLTAFREAHPEFTYLEVDGVPAAIRVFDCETGEGAARSFLYYRIPEGYKETRTEESGIVYTEDEDFYLFFSKDSVHIRSLSEDRKGDDAALELVLYFMTLD